MRLSLCTLLFFFRLSSLRADTSGGDNVKTSHGHDDYHNRLRGNFRRLEDEKVVAPMTRESFVNDCETDFLGGALSDGMITAPEYAKFMADACLSSGGDCAQDYSLSALNFQLQNSFVVTYLNMECNKGEVSKDEFDACKVDLGISLGDDFVYQMVVDQEDEVSRARIVNMCEKMWKNAGTFVMKVPTAAPTTLLLTVSPSNNPSMSSSYQPSLIPSKIPSSTPTIQPSILPSTNPSMNSSTQPSLFPSNIPSRFPSSQFSYSPSNISSRFNITFSGATKGAGNKRSKLLGGKGPVVITGATVLGSVVLVSMFFAFRRLCQRDGDKVQPKLEVVHDDFISGNSTVVPNTKLGSQPTERQNEECPITKYIAFEKNSSDDERSFELLSVASSKNDLVADIDSAVHRNDWDAMAEMAGDTNTEDGNSSGDSIKSDHISNSSLMINVKRENRQRHSLLSVASTEFENQSDTDGNSIYDLHMNNGYHQGSSPLTEGSLIPETSKTNSTSVESKSLGLSLINIASASLNSPPSNNQLDSFELNSNNSEQDSSLEKDFDYLVNNSPERVKLHHIRSTLTKDTSFSRNLELDKFWQTDKSNSFESKEKNSSSTDSSKIINNLGPKLDILHEGEDSVSLSDTLDQAIEIKPRNLELDNFWQTIKSNSFESKEKNSSSTDSSKIINNLGPKLNILHEGEDSVSLSDTLDQAIEIKHNDLLKNKRESTINDLEIIHPEDKPLNVNHDNISHEDKLDESFSNQSESLTTKSSDGKGQGLISHTSDSVSSNGWSSGVMSDTLSDTLSVINDDEDDMSDHSDEIDDDQINFLENMIEEDDFQGVRTWKNKKREAETSKKKIFSWRESILPSSQLGDDTG